ncbi:meiosis-specific protein MEI4 isoform X2 [Lissotriton helveticus]
MSLFLRIVACRAIRNRKPHDQGGVFKHMEEAAESAGFSEVEDQSEVPTWFNLTTKMALALAIIRTKPVGRSAKSYTEYLAKEISGHELNWKSKVKELEAEVLRLRQQLFLSKIRSANASEKGDTSTLAASQEENIPNELDDSGCDTCNEERITLVDNLQSFENSLCTLTNTSFLDWPSSSLDIKQNNCVGIAKALSAHTRFLQDLLGLRKLTESRNFTTNFTKFWSDSSIILDSVSGLLDGLLSLYQSPNDHFSALRTESINVLTNLISNAKWSNFVLTKCANPFQEFEKELISCIICNSSINRFQAQHSILDCLVMLGRCNLLRKPLLCLLLKEVSQFVDTLVQTQQVSKHAKKNRGPLLGVCPIWISRSATSSIISNDGKTFASERASWYFKCGEWPPNRKKYGVVVHDTYDALHP